MISPLISIFFGEVDMSVCAYLVDSTGSLSLVCGAPVFDYYGALVGGDHTVGVGSRVGIIEGGAWWYEDFPRLDLDLMGEGFDWP